MFRPDKFDYEVFEIELLNIAKTGKKCLILEGSSDKLFFRNMLNENRDILVVCVNSTDSKNHMISFFNNNEFIQENQNVIGVIDRDLDLNERLYSNLIVTRFNDIENYYFQFESFKNFIYEYFDAEDIKRIFNVDEINNISLIRENIYKKVSKLTKLRLASNNFNLQIPLGKVFKKSPEDERKKRYKKVAKTIDKNFEICEEKLIRYMYSSTDYNKHSANEIIEKVQEINITDIDFCTNGHDLVSLIAVIINDKSSIDDIRVEESLRLTVQKENYYEFEELLNIYNWIVAC